jgi:hypothetical protein
VRVDELLSATSRKAKRTDRSDKRVYLAWVASEEKIGPAIPSSAQSSFARTT